MNRTEPEDIERKKKENNHYTVEGEINEYKKMLFEKWISVMHYIYRIDIADDIVCACC